MPWDTVQLLWRLGRVEDLRAYGVAAIDPDDDSVFGGLRDSFRRLGERALESAQDGDEVWTWQPAEDCLWSVRIGLALVRGEQVVETWR